MLKPGSWSRGRPLSPLAEREADHRRCPLAELAKSYLLAEGSVIERVSRLTRRARSCRQSCAGVQVDHHAAQIWAEAAAEVALRPRVGINGVAGSPRTSTRMNRAISGAHRAHAAREHPL